MSRAEQPQEAPQPPAPRAGHLWIDINHPDQRVDLVYPTLITLIEGPMTTKEAP